MAARLRQLGRRARQGRHAPHRAARTAVAAALIGLALPSAARDRVHAAAEAAEALAPSLLPESVARPVAAPDDTLAFELRIPGVDAADPPRLLVAGTAEGFFADFGAPPSRWTSHRPPQRLVALRLFDAESGSLRCGLALFEPVLVPSGELAFGGLRELRLVDGFAEPRACAALLPEEDSGGRPAAASSETDPIRRSLSVRVSDADHPDDPEHQDAFAARVETWAQRWTVDGLEPLGEPEPIRSSKGDEDHRSAGLPARGWLFVQRGPEGRERLVHDPWPGAPEGWPREAADWKRAEPGLELLSQEERGALVTVRLRAPSLEASRRLQATITRSVAVHWIRFSPQEEDGSLPFEVRYERRGGER